MPNLININRMFSETKYEVELTEITSTHEHVYIYIYIFFFYKTLQSIVLSTAVLVGPCHHGNARHQVADRGTASDKEGSCE